MASWYPRVVSKSKQLIYVMSPSDGTCASFGFSFSCLSLSLWFCL